MDAVPDAIVEEILSHMSDARDVASCSCVSKLWNDSVPSIPSLYFPRGAFHGHPVAHADAAVERMIASAACLEELVVYCPFSASALSRWISLCARSLRRLELRMDCSSEKPPSPEASARGIDAIAAAEGLEELKLWGVYLLDPPDWGVFRRMRRLEIVGAPVRDDALGAAIRACPNLTDLVLLGCDGAGSMSIELERLETCRMDFLGSESCSLYLQAPLLHTLEIQGFSSVRVHERHQLRSLTIAKNSGILFGVDVGKLPMLELLSIRGVQWSWTAISSLLRCASEVRHLLMKVEFSGDFESLQPFPQVDFVEFFAGHPNLRTLEMHGAMFAALCQKNNILQNQLDSARFRIPCLEEVMITVRSPLNAEQKLSTLWSLVRHSERLCKIAIRVSRMRNCHGIGDDFFREICRFRDMNKGIVVSIE